jgi:Cu+-exporting ATPase
VANEIIHCNQVSTGVSVAYSASVALLVIQASQSMAPMSQMSYNTTYFDSVVFLTLFLLTGQLLGHVISTALTLCVAFAGRYLEAYSKTRTADSISALGSLYPTDASVLVPRSLSDVSLNLDIEDLEKGDTKLESEPGFKIEKIDVGLLEVGDIVRVQNGSSPPADGTIVTGEKSAFDESSLTGESKLVKKQIGDKVFVGTINKSGVVDIRVDIVGGGTM